MGPVVTPRGFETREQRNRGIAETHHRGIDRGAALPPHNFTGVNLLQILDAEAHCDEALVCVLTRVSWVWFN